METQGERYSWIRDLVRAEEQIETTGLVDMANDSDVSKLLANDSVKFLNELKNEFVEAANAFNDLKISVMGRIKIYGIAKTQADFMLFRNGFKMIFALREPGVISIRFNFFSPNSIPSTIPAFQGGQTSLNEEHLIMARRGPFDEIVWTFQEQPISIKALVKYHMTLFIRESVFMKEGGQ